MSEFCIIRPMVEHFYRTKLQCSSACLAAISQKQQWVWGYAAKSCGGSEILASKHLRYVLMGAIMEPPAL